MECMRVRKFKVFPAWQDDKEEAWLGQMAREVERCAAGQALVFGANRAGGDILEADHVLDVIRLAAGRIPADAVRAFATMMRRKIVMPAILMRDISDDNLYLKFSRVAQRIGVYTA